MDLRRRDNEAAAPADLLAAQTVRLDDFFSFDVARTTMLDELLAGVAVRYQVRSRLAGRTFENFIVDVGFSPHSAPEPDLLRGPDLLAFAGIDPIEVPVVPLEQHVAEKLHAYARDYGGAGRPSTREKDLVDLVLICTSSAFEAGRLRTALRTTFAERRPQSLPPGLPLPPSTWGRAYARLATEVGIDPNVRVGHALAAAFLDPVLGGIVSDDARWDPGRQTW